MPALLMLRSSDKSVASEVNGSWFLWVVGTQSLATLVTLRLLTVRSEPKTLGASYWIYMGATAITVLAGSRILVLPADAPIVTATSAIVSGLTLVLWAFGVWWVPLLVVALSMVLALWRPPRTAPS